VSRPGEFANITGRLVLAVRERQEKSNTRDSETDVFVSKLQEQRGVMPAAAFKAAMRAVLEMERSSQLLLCRQIAEAIAEAMAPLNVPLSPGIPKRRLRKRRSKAEGSQEATPASSLEQPPSDDRGGASAPSSSIPSGPIPGGPSNVREPE
jgi:hypothetical protein